jgi:hypothetical protein
MVVRGEAQPAPLVLDFATLEANSSYLWDTELRPGNAGTWDGSVELLASCFVNVPPDIRAMRVRADAGFGLNRSWKSLKPEPHSMWPPDPSIQPLAFGLTI